MMRYPGLLLVSVIVLAGCDSTTTVENPADTHFVRFYGQDGDQTGRDLVVLPDGNLVLFGTTKPTVPTKGVQWYVAKVDPNGAVIWEREFGGATDEEARDIELTSSNNLVLVGNTYTTSTERDLMIMTLTLDGVMIDSNSFAVRDNLGNPAAGDEDVATVTELPDGYLISGISTVVLKPPPLYPDNLHDGMQVRVHSDLQEYDASWLQLTGKEYDDGTYKIVVAPSNATGSYYLFGYTNDPTSGNTTYDFWLEVLGSSGVATLFETWQGSGSADERVTGFDYTPTGYVLSGISSNTSGASDLYIVESSVPDAANGWKFFLDQPLGLNLGSTPNGHSSVLKSQDFFYVLGNEASFDNNQNWVLSKIDYNGTAVWSSPLVYGGQGMDECGAIKETADGRLMIIGTMRTGRPDAGEFKMTLIKVNKDGKFE